MEKNETIRMSTVDQWLPTVLISLVLTFLPLKEATRLARNVFRMLPDVSSALEYQRKRVRQQVRAYYVDSGPSPSDDMLDLLQHLKHKRACCQPKVGHWWWQHIRPLDPLHTTPEGLGLGLRLCGDCADHHFTTYRLEIVRIALDDMFPHASESLATYARSDLNSKELMLSKTDIQVVIRSRLAQMAQEQESMLFAEQPIMFGTWDTFVNETLTRQGFVLTLYIGPCMNGQRDWIMPYYSWRTPLSLDGEMREEALQDWFQRNHVLFLTDKATIYSQTNVASLQRFYKGLCCCYYRRYTRVKM